MNMSLMHKLQILLIMAATVMVDSEPSTLKSTRQEYKAVDETEVNDQTLDCCYCAGPASEEEEEGDYEDIVGDIFREAESTGDVEGTSEDEPRGRWISDEQSKESTIDCHKSNFPIINPIHVSRDFYPRSAC